MASIMLDSGAFSAWSRGGAIDLQDYIAFLQRHEHLIDLYISLDVIAGLFPYRAWRRHTIEKAAAQSYANHRCMRRNNLIPIPVFHQGDSWDWLSRYLNDGESYVALATDKRASRVETMDWLDQCFEVLSDARGQPRVKTHALGLSDTSLARRHPWSTLDSTRWLQSGGHGHILIPREDRNGEPDYSLPPRQIATSNRSRGRSNHIDLIADHDLIDEYLRDEVGCTLSHVRSDHNERLRACIAFLQRSVGPGLHFVINSVEHARLMIRSRVNSILLSYFYVQEKSRALEKCVGLIRQNRQ
jgi:hypothetical protein